MSVGLLGGAFDPPHNGHVALAEEAIRHFRLDRLLVVVTGHPPHKEVATDAETRFQLARAAFEHRPAVALSRHELEQEGPSYTVDTVSWAASQWYDLVVLIGADEFAGFLSWKDPDRILALARVGVATRPGYPRGALDEVLARLRHANRVELFEIPPVEVSSSQVRARVAAGEPIGELVPPRVAELVAGLGLYREGG